MAGRRPVDGREARSRQRMLVALGRLARPFDQDADPTHVTGSAVVLGPRGVLLHRHKRLGIWLQPGGHLEPGETPWDAARREADEETGLALRCSLPGAGPARPASGSTSTCTTAAGATPTWTCATGSRRKATTPRPPRPERARRCGGSAGPKPSPSPTRGLGGLPADVPPTGRRTRLGSDRDPE